jgi:glycosyltransferase
LEPLRRYTEVEVIVQDGGSTDSTRDVLLAEQELNPRLTFLIESDNGQADALNKALGRATGRYIGWLNADDLYYPDGLASIIKALQQTDADVVYGDFDLIDQSGNRLRRYTSAQWSNRRFYKKGSYIFSGATFWDANFLRRLGFNADLRYTMDLDLYLRADPTHTVHVPKPTGALRIHGASKTGSQAGHFAAEALCVRLGFAEGSRRKRLLAYYVYARSRVIIALQPIRMSRIYSAIRRGKRL